MLLDQLQRTVAGVRIVHHPASAEDPKSGILQVVPLRPLEDADLEKLLAQLWGTTDRIVTSALPSDEQRTFRDHGFSDLESLHILRHSLNDLPQRRSSFRTRSGRRTDLRRVLDIDRRSFDSFWALNHESLRAARKATPVHRYRVALFGGLVVGYAVVGRAGSTGFLQRLGVDPQYRGIGVGSQLVLEAMQWARSDGAKSMLVNTQNRNETALRLYQSLGFLLSDEQLTVLQWDR